MAYNLIPGVDESYNFPPEVIAALKTSLGVLNVGAPMTTAQRNLLNTASLGEGYYIFNTDVQSFQVWRADFESWHDGLESPGTVKDWAGNVIPAGWMKMTGQELSRSDYASLYSRIGNTYGAGNGSTTFNLPDLSGRVTIDADSEFELGVAGGENEHIITLQEMPKHKHSGKTEVQDTFHTHTGQTTTDGSHHHDYIQPAIGDKANLQGSSIIYRNRGPGSIGGGGHTHNIATTNESAYHKHSIPEDGGSEPMRLMQSYVPIHKIIKY